MALAIAQAAVAERDELAPALVPQDERHAAQALKQRESAGGEQLGVLAQHIGQPVI